MEREGSILINSGHGDAGTSGSVQIGSGSASEMSGDVSIESGSASIFQSGGVTISSGSTAGGASGDVVLSGGASTGPTGSSVRINAGGNTAGDGGSVFIKSGMGGVSGKGGDIIAENRSSRRRFSSKWKYSDSYWNCRQRQAEMCCFRQVQQKKACPVK